MIMLLAEEIRKATIQGWYKMQTANIVDTGMMDGGCLIFAKAFLQYSKSISNRNVKCNLMSLISENGVTQHFCARIESPEKVIYVDSDGIHSAAEMLDKISKVENIHIEKMTATTAAEIEETEAYKAEELVNLLFKLVALQITDGFGIDQISLEKNNQDYEITFTQIVKISSDPRPTPHKV